MANVDIYGLISLKTVEEIPESIEAPEILAHVTNYLFKKLVKEGGKQKLEKGFKIAINLNDSVLVHEIVNIDEQGLHIRSYWGNIQPDEDPVSFLVKC